MTIWALHVELFSFFDSNCADFDFCERCEAVEGRHNPDHIFLRIHKPVMSAGRRKDGTLAPLLKYNVYQHEEQMIKSLVESVLSLKN